MLSTRDLQARLRALGFNPGSVDGMMGPKTRKARNDAMLDLGVSHVDDLVHPSGIHRLHWHWTAGAYGVIALEQKSYNGLVDEKGNRHDGLFHFNTQGSYRVGRAASHTLNANSGAIGLSADAMAGARERPFNAGRCPMTDAQIDELCRWSAELCDHYDIPVSPWSTLSHAEIQPTLGIRQRFKWDITWLPGMAAPAGPIEVGDILRAKTSQYLADLG